MRRRSIFFLYAYIALTLYIYARSFLELPHQVWTFFVLPLLALGFVLTHSAAREGWRRTSLLLTLIIAVTLFMEVLGVATGWVFGKYHYTDVLGPLFLGLVPYVVPIVWLNMLYSAYLIADQIIPDEWDARRRLFGVSAVSGLAMAAWDLIMDPVMVTRGHWVWENGGAWFGIPPQNFLGWWLTSFVAIALYLWLGSKKQRAYTKKDDHWAIILYAVMGIGTVVSGIQTGYYLAALAGFAAMGVLVVWSWNSSFSRFTQKERKT
jgi:putative membrane protein